MFRIGEFSKIAQVPGSQLRYYDEIGLLNPAKIDDWTGYRYYSAQQLPRLNRILALKELGLSLDQIKRMLDQDVSSEEIQGMYALKKAQLEQTLHEELLRLRQLEARIKMIEEGELPGEYEIIIKSVPEQPFLSVREICPNFVEAQKTIAELHRLLPEKGGQNNLGSLTAILHSESFESQDIDLEMGYVTTGPLNHTLTLSGNRTLVEGTLPAVETMATVMWVGLPQTSHQCRGAVASWVEANGFQFAGVSREVFHMPPQPGQEEESVLEIQYPIENAVEAG